MKHIKTLTTRNLKESMKKGGCIIDHIVHYMDGTAVHIHHDIVSIAFILVYH